MPPFTELATCAEYHLDAYCNNRGSRFAWVTYDGPGDPGILSPADVLATGFVNVPIGKRQVWEMFGANNEYGVLRRLIQAVLDQTSYAAPVLEELSLGSGPEWAAIEAAMLCTDTTARFTPTVVSKILHRKRPNLMPMMDRHVFDAYAEGTKDWRETMLRLQGDLREHSEALDRLRAPYQSPDGRPMTRLRALDIVVWHHAHAGDAPLRN